MPSIYLSPSLQEFNEYYDKSGSEEYYMNLIADAMEPYLEASDISFVRNSPDMTLTQVIRESNAGNYDLHLALHSNAAPDYLSDSSQDLISIILPEASEENVRQPCLLIIT